MVTLLCLGDSYTIGEGVPFYEAYPSQAVQLLRAGGHTFAAPEILARTGWTTDELEQAIARTRLLPQYDFVTLLIGVNNEYRGRDLEEYARDFDALLRQAIRSAGERPENVFVISIPDWGISPFAGAHLPDAKGRDQAIVSEEINAFNAAAEKLTRSRQVAFIDITEHSRSFSGHADAFTADGLHPSALQYQYWAQQLAEKILEQLA
jgi:lysophospholipase L1-like esterase